jgi:hypothetical protein
MAHTRSWKLHTSEQGRQAFLFADALTECDHMLLKPTLKSMLM